MEDINLIQKLANFLCISSEDVKEKIYKFCHRYKKYTIPKKSGGKRLILHPCKEMKALQYGVHTVILNKIDVHDIAYAYRFGKKSPLKQSAAKHVSYKYTVRIDFKDFFPSIIPADLIIRLKEIYRLTHDDCVAISKILFYFSKSISKFILPIGAPTSPIISNIVMKELDDAILKASLAIDPKSSISRYADDLYFSTNTKGLCRGFYSAAKAIISASSSPVLFINEDKTLFLSRGTRRVVNGLFVTPDQQISIGRSRKEAIKTMLYKHSKKELSHDDILTAQGMLAFIQDCEPDYYNKLALKYGSAFFSIKEYKRSL